MKTTSLELSKKLYKTFGWDRTDKSWWIEQWGDYDSEVSRYAHKEEEDDANSVHFPAYDTDYLLDKLPRYINESTNELILGRWGSRWRACYMPINLGHYSELRQEADTPAEALGLLALKLKEEGML